MIPDWNFQDENILDQRLNMFREAVKVTFCSHSDFPTELFLCRYVICSFGVLLKTAKISVTFALKNLSSYKYIYA